MKMASGRLNLREGNLAVCQKIVVAIILIGTVSMAVSSRDCPQVSSYATPSVITQLELISCKPEESKFVYKIQPWQTALWNFTCLSNKPNKWIWQGYDQWYQPTNQFSVTKEYFSRGHYEQKPIYASNITIHQSKAIQIDPIDTNFSCSFVTQTQKWTDSKSTCVEIVYDPDTQEPGNILVTYEKNTSDCHSGYEQSITKNGSVDCETELIVDIQHDIIYCSNSELYQTTCNDLDLCAARLEGVPDGIFCKGKASSAFNATTNGVLLLPRSASPVIVSCSNYFRRTITFVQLWPVLNFGATALQDVTYVESLDSVKYYDSFKVLALPFGVEQKTENFNLSALKEYSIRARRILAEDEEVVFLCVALKYLFMKGFKWSINNLTVQETQSVYDKSQALVISELRVTMSERLHSVHPVVSCTVPVSNTDKRVAQFASFSIDESERPKADVTCNEETNWNTVNCTCRFTGAPTPLVRWSVVVVGSLVEIVPFSEISSSNNLDRRDGFKIIRFTKPLSSDAFPTSVTCNLENFKGTYNATHFLKASIISNTWSPLWWVLTVFICVVILANGLLLFNKYWRSREERRNLTDEEIQQFFEGIPEAHQHGSHGALGNVDILPFPNEFKIPADDIEYDNSNTQLLGSGNFSIVVRGKLLSKSVNVAIKIPKPWTNVSQFKGILSEVKIMIYVGCHENLVHLIGICTEKIRSRSIRIITEICELGSLQNLLRKAAASFINLLNSNQEIDGTMLCSLDAPQHLSTLDLVCFSAQIASGMVFLVQKNIIHGDLASRNVLISSNKCAKISDFGLSKQLYDDANYVKKSKTSLPWRWMAIESLTKMTFSHRSDVWAYGVTLYEIFSLGDIPFSNETWNNDFVARLQSGMRMGRPNYSSTDIYAKVSACWERDPENRPDFASLYEFFRNLQIKLEREFHCENNSGRLGQTVDHTPQNQDAPNYLELIERDSNQDAKVL